MRDERTSIVPCRIDGDLGPRRTEVDEAQEVRSAPMRREAPGDESRRPKSDSFGQRSSANEVDARIQAKQSTATDTFLDLMRGEAKAEKLCPSDEARL